MSIVDRLFQRPPAGAALDLPALQARFAAAAARGAGRPPDPDLVRARLADACRDTGVTPVLPEVFDELAPKAISDGPILIINPSLPERFDGLAQGLDDEALRRLALAVGAFDDEGVCKTLPHLPAIRNDGRRLVAVLRDLARETPLLTLELLRDSPLRAEEFARQFIARLGARVHGETAEQSKRRLERLDYERLLAEAEQARQSAEGRAKHIRDLQDEQEKRRPRRGKW